MLERPPDALAANHDLPHRKPRTQGGRARRAADTARPSRRDPGTIGADDDDRAAGPRELPKEGRELLDLAAAKEETAAIRAGGRKTH
jgi:hypothetical protein